MDKTTLAPVRRTIGRAQVSWSAIEGIARPSPRLQHRIRTSRRYPGNSGYSEKNEGRKRAKGLSAQKPNSGEEAKRGSAATIEHAEGSTALG